MAHRLLIGKGMITLNLKRIFLTLTLLPLFAVAADDCSARHPTENVVVPDIIVGIFVSVVLS